MSWTQPWRCLCRGSSQMIRTTPLRLISLHLSQMRFTLDRTFMVHRAGISVRLGNYDHIGRPKTGNPDLPKRGYFTFPRTGLVCAIWTAVGKMSCEIFHAYDSVISVRSKSVRKKREWDTEHESRPI